MPPRSVRLFLLCLSGGALSAPALDAPRPWEPDAFLPLTEQRIAALPAAEQGAWRAYWHDSIRRAGPLPARDLADRSPTRPLAGPPLGASYSQGLRLGAPAAWYGSAQAQAIADHVVKWQTPAGGWNKSGDYTRDPAPQDNHHDGWSAGTFDNNGTVYELRFLALVAAPEPGERGRAWREAFLRGLDYIFAAQYPNGGFPQIYPLAGGYHDAITYNDDAMVHVLGLLRDVAARRPEFAFVPAGQATLAKQRLARGIACVLATQLKNAEGRLTVWGQQHDALTLRPCAARNFEPISECSSESVGLVQFLLSLPDPSPGIVAAIDGAVAWFSAHALHGVTWDRDATTGTGLVAKADAPALWARFYEIGTGKPIFSERDRMVHYTVTALSLERRQGYGWYNTRANALPAAHAAWKAKLAAK